MIEAIARLRSIAEKVQGDARTADLGPVAETELIDLAARWHWLAAQAAKLCRESKALNACNQDCDRCAEKCD